MSYPSNDSADAGRFATSASAGPSPAEPWKQLAHQLLITLDFQLTAEESGRLHLESIRQLLAADQPAAAHEILMGTQPEDLLPARP